MVDFSFQNNKTLADYMAANQEREMKAQLILAKAEGLAQGGNMPAAQKMAIAYQDAVARNDIPMQNALIEFSKSRDKGFQVDDAGQTMLPDSYASALQNKAYVTQQGQNVSDLAMKPKIANLVANQTEQGKEAGIAAAGLSQAQATLPQLEETANKLNELGQKATYTYAGQTKNAVMRQLGMVLPEGAVKRAEYIAYVDNQVLPLLRQTFGAQFTQKEGESLKVTLGDPNKSPEEKDAVLRSFIANKQATIATGQRRVGQSPEDILKDGDLYEKSNAKFKASRNPPPLSGFKYLGKE